MSFVSIGIKTSIPVTAPAATSGAVTFTSIDPVNWLQITGDASAGSGSLYLLRWYPDLAEWRVYMEDKPMSVNSATFSGQFSGHYPFPSREESFVLYDPAAAITATASAARTSSPLTALSVTMASTLPTGAATAAKQDTGNASLSSIDTKLSSQATAAKQDTGNTSLATIATQQTDGTQKTQVTSSALPTGAATAAKQPALGTAGTPSADVLSVQGVVGGTPQPISATSLPLPTGAATETTLALLTVAQNSTTGGQSGPLMMGAVTTNAPTYLNNRTQPFSITLAGDARTIAKITDGTNTAAVKAASMAAAASDPSMVVAVSPNSPATVTGAAATGTAVSGNPVLIAGQDGTNARTMRLDTTGRPAGSSFQWRGAATSELLKSGVGVLRRVICGSNVAGTITLHDNTSDTGTVIVSLTTTTTTPFNSVEINATFSKGLYAVSTGMSGGSYTIVWD